MKSKLIILLGLIMLFVSIWAHHMFMSGVNPFLSNFVLLPLSIIFIIGIFNLTKKVGDYISDRVTRNFSIGFLVLLILSALKGVFFGNSAIDLQLHDTYFVINDFYILFLFSLIFGFYAIAYFVIPKIIRRKLNKILGQIHFWLTTIVTFFLVYPIYSLGMAGVPRRYYNTEQIDTFIQIGNVNMIITILAILVFLSQFTFVVNLVYSLLKGPKV